MTQAGRFAIVCTPEVARSAARYVTRGFFSPRELPQAMARMVLTREFALFVGVPVVLLLAARWIADRTWDGGWAASALTGVAVAWLVAGLLRISCYGPSLGIGCYRVEPDGSRGALIGGLRMRLQRSQRRIWIAGLLVEPAWRGAGIGAALMLAGFRMAQRETANGPVTVAVFAPSHPASKAIVARHLRGRQAVVVSDPSAQEAQRVIASLEAAAKKSGSEFQWELAAPARGLF